MTYTFGSSAMSLKVFRIQNLEDSEGDKVLPLSLEAVFAAIGGWLILGEVMSGRGMLGCLLMFTGMLVSQLYGLLVKSGQDAGIHAAAGRKSD